MEDIDRFLEKRSNVLKLSSLRESQKANSFLTFVFNGENKKIDISNKGEGIKMGSW